MTGLEFYNQVNAYSEKETHQLLFDMISPYSCNHGYSSIEYDEDGDYFILLIGNDFDSDDGEREYNSKSLLEILNMLKEKIDKYGDKDLYIEVINGLKFDKELVGNFRASYGKLYPEPIKYNHT